MPSPDSSIPSSKTTGLLSQIPLTFRPGVTEAEFKKHFSLKYEVEAVTIYEAQQLGWPTDRTYWRFLAPFRYLSPKWGVIEIPENFPTDFASVPSRLHSLIDNDSPIILYPSAPHDYLFSKRPNGTRGWIGDKQLSLNEVNHLPTEAMAICGADIFLRNLVFAAVEVANESIRHEFA